MSPVPGLGVVGFAGLLMATCSSSTVPSGGLPAGPPASGAAWDSRLRDYTFTFQRTCSCPPEIASRVRVRVEDAAVVEVRDAETGEAYAPERFGAFPTVEGVLELIARARGRGAQVVDVDYDPQLGYPVRVRIDNDTREQNDEEQLHLQELRPLRP